jgi:hypothetical protein
MSSAIVIVGAGKYGIVKDALTHDEDAPSRIAPASSEDYN